MSFFKFFLCFILSFLFLSFRLPSAVFETETLSEVQLLMSFKNSLSDPNLLGNWFPDRNPCSFSGIFCVSNHVSAVDLSYSPLNINFSHVASYLLTLGSLEKLSLRSTYLSGSIFMPPEAKCGALLLSLDFSQNSLSGSLSDLMNLVSCPSLKSLNLSDNLLSYTDMGLTKWNLKLQTIDLSFNMIAGPDVISWMITGGCDDLMTVSLKGNKISETVDVLSCKKLEHFDISDNKFSRVVPSFSDCSALKYLDISANMFHGDIEKAVSGCAKLNFLNITANNISGLLPAFRNKKLQFLYLSRNNFQGGFPQSFIEACSSLVMLDISSNNLSGTVPSELASCSSLQSINLSGNHLTGELPIETLLKFRNLKDVTFSKNRFFGNLPRSLTSITTLETLDLSGNFFSGSIPSWLCENPNNRLKNLYLQSNVFTGSIPPTLSNCSELVSLDLSFNYLKGTIPQSFGSLSKLNDLLLWFNQLHGEIPQELMHVQTLKNLILDFNQLTGSIPSDLSNCINLNWLSLSNNRLSGEIPAGIGHLVELAILTLSNNSFHGGIPPELGNSRKLVWVDLNTNRLSGTIPPELFRQSGHVEVLTDHKKYVFLRNTGNKHCHGAGNLLEFEGIRKEILERISAMNPCDFTRPYKGNIQPQFKHSGSLIMLDLSYNMFNGSIPKEIGKPEYINILYLSHNNFSGSIPDEMGNLKNLGILDISYNQLEGLIPQSMATISTVVSVDFSNNNLSGHIPDSAQFNTFPAERFANNSGLCGTPLSPCLRSGSTSYATHQKSNRRQASVFVSLAVALLFSFLCLVGFILYTREKRKSRKEKEALDHYSRPGSNFSSWKISNHQDALSINLATFEKPLKKLTFADLLEATNGFDSGSLIGSGGFGDVYRAQLKDGTNVAVKKLIHIIGHADREFTAEMETIGKIKHRNLVSLLGYCKVGEERLLVYEFMKNGSLEDLLHNHKKDGLKLNWAARRRIARGAARGLAFLHHSCIPHIIHRDMKSSNVLLDDNLDARVSDFGMARLVSAMDTHLSVSTLAGTPGYVPPEYYQSFRCSTKGDVYSYGVVLLELLTGRRCTGAEDFGDSNLVGWVKQHGESRARDVLDPVLMEENPSPENELLEHLNIAKACVNDLPSQRPTMIQVMTMLREIQAEMSRHIFASTSATTAHAGEVEMAEMRTQDLPEICEVEK